jgi:uncharacterized membrane protein
MTDEQQFKLSFGVAVVCYIWGFIAMWLGYEQAIPGDTFFGMGILPMFVGVVAMVFAIQARVNILADEEDEQEAEDVNREA